MTLCTNSGAALQFEVEPVHLPAGRHPTDGLSRLLLRATGNCSRITVVMQAPGAPGIGSNSLHLVPVRDWEASGMLIKLSSDADAISSF